MVNALLSQYQQRLQQTLEHGKHNQEFAADLDVKAAALLFIGSIQGLVVQSIVQGNSDTSAASRARYYFCCTSAQLRPVNYARFF